MAGERCNQCGAPIPGDADTLGLCPACLIRRAMGKGASRGFEPPAAEEVQSELNQLDVLELVGFGGMGVVYKARQRSLDRLVAVKVFPREMWDDPGFELRFRREARLLASLSHPHIVTAHEYGETDAYYYLLMELVRGRSLRQVLRDGPLRRDEAIRIACEVCSALEHAHGHGVVHRDIKPENILVETTGRVRVADFGLAKLVGADDPAHRAGTPEYMAPEQRDRPAEVDGRADVYSLGVVLHEMLTGRTPSANVVVPGRVARVVRKCLAEDPRERYQQVSELRDDLEALRRPGRKWLVPILTGTAVVLATMLVFWWVPRVAKEREDARWPDPIARMRERPAPPSFAASRPAWMPDVPRPTAPAGPVVTFRLEGVTQQDAGQIIHRLKQLGAQGVWTSSSGGRMTALVTPAADVETWARKVDFGTVVKTDPDGRVVQVRVDLGKLPPPLATPVTDPGDPSYYSQNLADLRAWDPQRRREAIGRLKPADPGIPLAGDIRAALADLAMKDTDYFVRRNAVEALANWGGPEAVGALETVMRDSHLGIRRAAIDALRKIGESRIAELLRHPERDVRLRAVRVLGEIGAAQSLIPLGEAAGSGDAEVERAADAALKAIEARIDKR